MTKTANIGCGSFEQVGIVSECANAGVAVGTQKRPHESADVVVIHVERQESPATNHSLWTLADGAKAILLFQQFLIVAFGQVVLILKMLTTNVRSERTRGFPSFVTYFSLLGKFRLLLWRHLGAAFRIAEREALFTAAVLGCSYDPFVVSISADESGHVGLGQTFSVATTEFGAHMLLLFRRCACPLFAASRATAFAAKTALESAYNIFVMAMFAKVWLRHAPYTITALRLAQAQEENA